MTDLAIVTYPCGHTLEVMLGRMLSEACPACQQGLPEGSSQCEDYPCCGHTDGDGCMPNPRHTSDYWRERMARMTSEELDYYDQNDLW